MVVVADASVVIRGDLEGFRQDLAGAKTQTVTLGAEIRQALSFGPLAAQGPDALVGGLERAAVEADQVNASIRRLAESGKLPAADARKYADLLDEIGIEADQTAAELKQLRAAEPAFNTPAIRAAGTELDRVGREAKETAGQLNAMKGVRADTHLERLAQEARESSKALDSTGKSSKGLIEKLNTVKGALIGLGLFISAQQIISGLRNFFGDAVDSATAFQTATRGIETVLGESAATVQAFGETSAESFGLSKRAVSEFGAVLGAQLKAADFELGEAADETIRLEGLAADLAATFGGEVGDAVTAIGALLRGERDTIEKYGVSIKQVDVNARIASLGLDTSTAAALKNATAVASLSLLYEQTSDSVGAFARNSDTNAVIQAKANAQIENAMIKLGDALLPLVAGFTELSADVLPGLIDGVLDVMKAINPFMGLLAEAAKVVIPVLAVSLGVKLVTALRAVELRAKMAGFAFKGMLGPIALLVAAAEGLKAISDPLDDWTRSLIHGAEAMEELGTLTEIVGDEMKANVIGQRLHDWGVSIDEFKTLVDAAEGDVDEAFQAIADSAGDVDEAMRSIVGPATSMSVEWASAWERAAAAVVEAEEGVEESFSGLKPAMQAAVDEVMATAKEVPEGVSVTLDNGTEIVAASATDLAQLLPAAIRQARRDAVIAAYPAPGEIAAAILAGKKELDPVRQMLIDALTKPVSDAKSLVQAQALLFDPLLGRALGKTGFSETQAAGLEAAGLLVDSILAAEPDIFDAGTKMPPAIARGFKSTRGDVIQAVRDLNDDQAMTAGEVAKYLEDAGEDGLAALVRGIRSKKPAVNTAQDEVNAGILLRASKLAGIGYTAGENLARGVGSGITDYTYVPVTATGTMARYIGKQLPLNSPPEDPNSPLANIMDVGGNIVDAITGGIYDHLRQASRVSALLAGALNPNLGIPTTAFSGRGGMTPFAPVSGSPAGGDTINVHLPGRERRLTASEIAGDLRRLGEMGKLTGKPRPPND